VTHVRISTVIFGRSGKKKEEACKISQKFGGVSLESLLRFVGITVEGYFGKKNT
jgi:hypothetical protein